MYIYGIRVDDLIVRDGRVCGVIAGDEEMESDLVILADGVNSLLAQKIGMKKELLPSQSAVGAKEIIQLDAATIEQRFQLNPGEGLAWIFQGDCTDGRIGDGFLYTNGHGISWCPDYHRRHRRQGDHDTPAGGPPEKSSGRKAPDRRWKIAEYSAHLVPEGGYSMVPTLYRDGVLLAGDAASLCHQPGIHDPGNGSSDRIRQAGCANSRCRKGKGGFLSRHISVLSAGP